MCSSSVVDRLRPLRFLGVQSAARFAIEEIETTVIDGQLDRLACLERDSKRNPCGDERPLVVGKQAPILNRRSCRRRMRQVGTRARSIHGEDELQLRPEVLDDLGPDRDARQVGVRGRDELEVAMSSESAKWVVDQFLNPEVKRRFDAGEIAAEVAIARVQVVLYADKPAVIRLNDEVRGILSVKAARDIAKGEIVYSDDISAIGDFERSPEDGDAAHITMFHLGEGWHIIFDFAYNRARSLELVEAGDQFLDSARSSLDRSRLRPFVEDLWSATELYAKAYLLALPIRELLASKGHGLTRGLFHWWASYDGVPAEYPKLLQALDVLRLSARYLQTPFDLPLERARHEVFGLSTGAKPVEEKTP
jgi:hypothetical protein